MCTKFSVEELGINVEFKKSDDLHPRLMRRRKIVYAIVASEEGKQINMGYAIYNPKDVNLDLPFNFEYGKKIALTRAISIFPKDLREQIWNAYWKAYFHKN